MRQSFRLQVSGFKFLKSPIIYISLIFTFHLSFLSSLYAEEKVKIGEIVVTATRIEEVLEDVPSSVTVITKEEIKDSTAENITELLRDVVGLRISEYGKKGTLAVPRLRGSTAGQVLILLDGKRLNLPGSGQFDLNNLPVSIDDIERIEILRGASSALYGADAMGGIINIITKKPEKLYTKIGGSYGGLNTQQYSLLTSGKFKALGYFFSLSKDKSDGFRPNSYYDSTTANGKVVVDLSNKSTLELSLSVLYKESGVPGSITYPSPRAEESDENINFGVTYKGKLSDKIDVITKIYRNYFELVYKDPDIFTDDKHKDIFTGGEVQVNYLYNPSNLFTAGIEIGEEKVNSTATGSHKRSRKGVFLQDEIKPSEPLTVIPGIRFDSFSPGEDQFSPKISALYKLKEARFRASIGRGYRVPTFNDLYWPDNAYSKGNPDLKPERSIEYEIGWDQEFGNTFKTKTTAFRKDVKDLIIWQPDPLYKWVPSNMGEARIQGIELEGKVEVQKSISMNINYTFLDPEDTITGQKITGLPKHQFGSSVTASTTFGLRFTLDGRYVNNYTKQGEPSVYFVMDGKITQEIILSSKVKGEAFFGIKNIFNKEYEVVKGYPMPPRELYGGFSIAF
jgi:outer membrane cobalamin receptor